MKRLTVCLTGAVVFIVLFVAPAAPARVTSSAEKPPTLTLKAANKYARAGLTKLYKARAAPRVVHEGEVEIELTIELVRIDPCRRAHSAEVVQDFRCHYVIDGTQTMREPGKPPQVLDPPQPSQAAKVEVVEDTINYNEPGETTFRLRGRWEVVVQEQFS